MSIGELNAEDLESLVGRELDGRYKLDKFLDRGGFGAVYRGVDNRLDQPVAVKVGQSHREFMKEAKLAAEVRHDHIVHVSDYGSDKGLAYLVMEFLQGDDLEKLFKKQERRLKPEQLVKFVNEVGGALAYAHDHHLIHRDLKPRNIILKQSLTKAGLTASADKFVLIDFGIAAKLDVEGTLRNISCNGAGTLEYMAPELMGVKPTSTPQSDIYAFGIIMYQMLTGRVPYPQTDMSHIALVQVVQDIVHTPPPSFADVVTDRTFTPALEKLVMQCLEKDPTRRPQTMVDVRDRFLVALAAPTKRPIDNFGTIGPNELPGTPGQVQHNTEPWPPGPPQPPPSSRWPWLFATFALVVVLSLAIGQQFLTGLKYHPAAVLTVMRGDELIPRDDASPLVLTAGERITLTFTIKNLPPNGTAPEFALPDVPASVHVQTNNGHAPGDTKSFTLSIPDLNTPAGLLPSITFRATVPGHATPFEKALSLEIRRPRPWLPESLEASGFRESSDSWLCQIGTGVFASVLERHIKGQTVRFRLVPATKIGKVSVETFYAMEQLVTNALFNEFAKAEPMFEWELRNRGEREWEAADDFPVTDIYVLETQRFAQWLGGPDHGSLPTTAEWELSAGYYDFLRVLKARDIPPNELRDFRVKDAIPGLGAEVWIGAGPTMNEFRGPQGTTLKECSPYGCRYARLRPTKAQLKAQLSGSRPTEMTSTLVNFVGVESELRELYQHGIPTKNDEANEALKDNLYLARLRGLGEPPGMDEVRWVVSEEQKLRVRKVEDLNVETASLSPRDGIALGSYIGFRVVLLTDIEQK